MTRLFTRALEVVLFILGLACATYVVDAVFEMRSIQSKQDRILDDMIAVRASEASRAPDPFTLDLREGDLVGRIEIARLGLRAAVLQGSDETTLKAAVGHLPGTARPGGRGNAVLAGHRDTFFRPLRNIHEGDEIVMRLAEADYVYRVTAISVVNPADVWVMDDTPSSVLTLVTCYPFYYVGPAPMRFIVRAVNVTDRR